MTRRSKKRQGMIIAICILLLITVLAALPGCRPIIQTEPDPLITGLTAATTAALTESQTVTSSGVTTTGVTTTRATTGETTGQAAPTATPSPEPTRAPTQKPTRAPTKAPTAAPAPATKSPYYLYGEKGSFTLVAYGQDENGQYTRVVRTMRMAIGRSTMTPSGKFTLSTRERWHTFNSICAQYAIRYKGSLYIHGPLYNYKDNRTMIRSYYESIGTQSTSGCLRLTTGDVYWIYNNCPSGTIIEIVSGSPRGFSPPPLLPIIKAGEDPTDPLIAKPTPEPTETPAATPVPTPTTPAPEPTTPAPEPTTTTEPTATTDPTAETEPTSTSTSPSPSPTPSPTPEA